MAADSLRDAVPLLRRYLEATYRLAELERDEPEIDEMRHRWLVAHALAARQSLHDYLIAQGWVPPEQDRDGVDQLGSILQPLAESVTLGIDLIGRAGELRLPRA